MARCQDLGNPWSLHLNSQIMPPLASVGDSPAHAKSELVRPFCLPKFGVLRKHSSAHSSLALTKKKPRRTALGATSARPATNTRLDRNISHPALKPRSECLEAWGHWEDLAGWRNASRRFPSPEVAHAHDSLSMAMSVSVPAEFISRHQTKRRQHIFTTTSLITLWDDGAVISSTNLVVDLVQPAGLCLHVSSFSAVVAFLLLALSRYLLPKYPSSVFRAIVYHLLRICIFFMNVFLPPQESLRVSKNTFGGYKSNKSSRPTILSLWGRGERVSGTI
jgi:hypothetical protein